VGELGWELHLPVENAQTVYSGISTPNIEIIASF